VNPPDDGETWPWAGSWPPDIVDTVRAMRGAFDLQPLFVAEEACATFGSACLVSHEAFDFYTALVEAIGAKRPMACYTGIRSRVVYGASTAARGSKWTPAPR
jgi:hypothetical protein